MSNGNVALMTHLAKFGGLPSDVILGSDLVRLTFVLKGLIMQPDRVLRVAVPLPDLFGLIETTS